MAMQAAPPPTIASRFASSLSDYVALNEYRPLLRPVEPELQLLSAAATNGKSFGTGSRELLEIVGRALIKQELAHTIRPIICGAATHADSVIELSMCFAIAVTARAMDYAVLFDFGEGAIFGDAEGEALVRIQLQAPIQNYRADLLVSMQYVNEVSDQFQVHHKRVAVECDGFDHHDRTTEQAIRDRERDRVFQAQGLSVFRYAGAEIWADVFACAQEVLKYLKKGIYEQATSPMKPAGRVRLVGPSEAAV